MKRQAAGTDVERKVRQLRAETPASRSAPVGAAWAPQVAANELELQAYVLLAGNGPLEVRNAMVREYQRTGFLIESEQRFDNGFRTIQFRGTGSLHG